jgi:hypothetical protein
MGKHAKTVKLLEVAVEVLTAQHPMTVRQVYYQLVSRQVIENNRGQYQAVSNALVEARKDGTIPWEWIEDRLRRPREVLMWENLTERINAAVNGYRRDVWPLQPRYVEVWLEKDALSGIFENALRRYGVTLNVGRGYDGWDSIHNAAERYQRWPPMPYAEDDPRLLEWDAEMIPTTILYFGDFDPSGEDMVRSLGERLAFFEVEPTIKKCALTADDVTRYQLPPDFTKATDTRRAAFVEKYGDIAVELDALPVEVLRARLVEEVEALMDLQALAEIRQLENEERQRLADALRDVS